MDYGTDIYTQPERDAETLRNLGPLDALFPHTDRNTLSRVAPSTPNPLAQVPADQTS